MLQTLIGIILLPFAALGIVFTGAIGVAIAKTAYSAIFKKKGE